MCSAKVCLSSFNFFAIVIIFTAGYGKSWLRNQQERWGLEFYYRVDYFNIYDLSGSVFPDEESLATLTSQYIREIKDVLELRVL